MTAATRTQAMLAARAQASRDKRQQVLTAVQALEAAWTPVTATAVAAAAGVSAWLVYATASASTSSQLYLGGMDLIAIQATLGHAWIATTMGYVHVPGTHIEDAWIAGQQRAAARLEGLRR